MYMECVNTIDPIQEDKLLVLYMRGRLEGSSGWELCIMECTDIDGTLRASVVLSQIWHVIPPLAPSEEN